jgi:hypothetical protein
MIFSGTCTLIKRKRKLATIHTFPNEHDVWTTRILTYKAIYLFRNRGREREYSTTTKKDLW